METLWWGSCRFGLCLRAVPRLLGPCPEFVLALRQVGSKGFDMSRKKTSSQTGVGERKLEHDRPANPSHRKKDNQHQSSHIHIQTFWSIVQGSQGREVEVFPRSTLGVIVESISGLLSGRLPSSKRRLYNSHGLISVPGSSLQGSCSVWFCAGSF